MKFDFGRCGIDAAMAVPEVVSICGASISSLREQSLLLLNTLGTMQQETAEGMHGYNNNSQMFDDDGAENSLVKKRSRMDP